MQDIQKLKESDIYSLSMFVLYKLTNVQEYSIMGELPYILNKDSLLNFCKYFGGRTIKVPTLEELYNIMHIILLYQYVKIDGIPYDVAVEKIGFKVSELKKVKTSFIELCKILNNYKFDRG